MKKKPSKAKARTRTIKKNGSTKKKRAVMNNMVSLKYDHIKLEKGMQSLWERAKLNRAQDGSKKKKFYGLIEFPYPSGDGLHVGHVRPYIGMDVISHKRRMEGFNVLFPIGWDAFGLPTENYAIKTGIQPAIVTKRNTANFRRQIQKLGVSFDWSREINTTDPKYYRWTQWIFLQLLKKGLAYKKKMSINWCPKDLIGLANEEVINGRCERCGTTVEKKEKEQWMLAITAYADRLLTDLDAVDTSGLPYIVDKKNPPRPGKKVVERRTIHALVRDPKTGKFLGLKWFNHPWTTFIVGGVEPGESLESAARREVKEEAGYTDLKFVQILGGPVKAEYYAAHKDQNRVAITTALLFELASDAQVGIVDEEKREHEPIWLGPNEMTEEVMTCAELPVWLERLKQPGKYAHDTEAKPLLNWTEAIKEGQRNWIGKSEGALIKFKVKVAEKDVSNASFKELEVFTTRPDTIFGVTYLVVAPEHTIVSQLLKVVKNREEVESYIVQTKKETDIQRTDASKEKTGVELKGVFAVNPANQESVPVWIADYVLADYGTGAVMAVPAHDERDWEFAMKYTLPTREVIVPVEGEPHVGAEFRKTISSVVCRKSDGKFLALKWNKFNWLSIPIGGIEKDESPERAAEREVLEETGYIARAVKLLGGQIESHFFAENKNVWRSRLDQPVLLEVTDENQKPVADEEKAKHQVVWMTGKEIIEMITHRYNSIGLQRHLANNYAYCGSGNVINSGQFNGRKSETIIREITDFVGGTWVTKFKLRDWVFSRQRYWGEPIPVVHCAACALRDPAHKGIIPLPEKSLPLILPKVKNYQPTKNGESPLAAITKWVNTKCPVCKGPARRETDTMPNWAGSSWYYLRYCDPKNTKQFADFKKLKYWTPVDWYNGGMEHTTLHLLYSRFWHKFLYDQGLVPTAEPYTKRTSHGMILAEGGEKMSKSRGNVINPDSIVETYGADTLRVYEMFMGPFEQAISWDSDNIIGSRRFIEKVWRLKDKVAAGSKVASVANSATPDTSLDVIIQKTVKKVSDDIEAMRFNTAISSLMIAVNQMESAAAITRAHYEIILQLLAPFAPHVTEALWLSLGNKKSIHVSSWPAYDPKLTVSESVKIMVQVSGKVRGSFMAETGVGEDELKKQAQNVPEVAKWLTNSSVKKVIVVPGRLVNFVLN